jgi:hypothetical protein
VQSGSTPAYSDAPDAASTTQGQPVSGNVLTNAAIPSGQTAAVTGFSIAGTSQIITTGSGPVTLTSPTTGQPVGTLTMQSSGAYTFTPAPGYVGPAPAVTVYSKTSGGQTGVSSLTLQVAPCQCGLVAFLAMQHAV